MASASRFVPHLLKELGRVGGGRKGQIVGANVLALGPLADPDIGADSVRSSGTAARRPTPLAPGTGARLTGPERAPSRRGDEVLGDAQRCESLAGAAGHDQLASVGVVQSGGDLLQRQLLVRTKLVSFALHLLRLGEAEL